MPIFKKTKPEENPDSEPEIEADSSPSIPDELPILPLKGVVVYPLTVLPLNVAMARTLRGLGFKV